MSKICVATSDAAAYYALVSRLKSAGLRFSSAVPPATSECDLVLTTEREAREYGPKGMGLEGLDTDPGVFKGQVVSRLDGGKEELLVGVDPGKRIGVAIFYGREKLTSCTPRSPDEACQVVANFVDGVPSGRVLVRVGIGNMEVATKVLDLLVARIPSAVLEMVDESGTSAVSPKVKGMQRDQVAAARIAFRRGKVVTVGGTRSASQSLR